MELSNPARALCGAANRRLVYRGADRGPFHLAGAVEMEQTLRRHKGHADDLDTGQAGRGRTRMESGQELRLFERFGIAGTLERDVSSSIRRAVESHIEYREASGRQAFRPAGQPGPVIV